MSKESLDFGLNLDLDIADFKEKWKTYEGQIQKTIDNYNYVGKNLIVVSLILLMEKLLKQL